ncbi:polyketide cyclase [Chryseobacterium sp. FH1]|uniref:polyketide cyclase n=1 Tax=Chryseobacterium sp. FH1 TaxID=1233951 RepID=UPI0004E3AAED|nr:polyketide cyclase [Chryseobacterium sp. FH1]KFC20511.1 polyketide cyclase [Chryseobacterium sp. FH1]
MRLLKFIIIIILCLFGIYSISMNFVDESKSFVHRSEIAYPVDKVFPQFNNLQNFTAWNDFFNGKKDISYSFFTPYEGIGSAMKFSDNKNEEFGDMFIRYSNPNRTLRYQLFEGESENPYLIDVKFIPAGEKTKMVWNIHTPKRSYLERSLNLVAEDFFVENIDKSMKNLFALLGNKVDKDQQLASIKYDSVMVENREGGLILGVNVSSRNTKDILFKNVLMNHNKVLNFVKSDLAKKDDEFGMPVLLTNASNLKDKEISYFYGIPLSKRVSVSDNNFNFQTLNASKMYYIYYQGNYNNRIKNIQELLKKVKKDTLRNGQLYEEFLEEPTDIQDVKLKLSLPVFR